MSIQPFVELEVWREVGVAAGTTILIVVFLRAFVNENIQQNKTFTDNLMQMNKDLMKTNAELLDNNRKLTENIKELTESIKLLQQEIRLGNK